MDMAVGVGSKGRGRRRYEKGVCMVILFASRATGTLMWWLYFSLHAEWLMRSLAFVCHPRTHGSNKQKFDVWRFIRTNKPLNETNEGISRVAVWCVESLLYLYFSLPFANLVVVVGGSDKLLYVYPRHIQTYNMRSLMVGGGTITKTGAVRH